MQRYQLWVYAQVVPGPTTWRMCGFFDTRQDAEKFKKAIDAELDCTHAYEIVAVATIMK